MDNKKGAIAKCSNGNITMSTRNPAILHILDPMHRSLLNNNLQYEQGKRDTFN